MSDTEFLGYFVVAVATLGGFMGVISKFTQPINELRLVIQKLNDKIDAISDNHEKIQRVINDHEQKISDLDSRIGKVETTVEIYHKEH